MKFIAGIIFILALSACTKTPSQQYEDIKAKELASGKIVNDIFFNIHFGMTSKDFYLYCWQMNKKGIFTDGENNSYVLYKLNQKELKHAATLNFYPDFKDGKISGMRAKFKYDGWAPWNKQLFSDSLQTDVLHLLQQWHPNGNPFIKIEDKNKGIIYVKVDGNRQIIIGRYSDMEVKVDYSNLLLNTTK